MSAPLPDIARRLAWLAAGLLAVTLCIAAGLLIGSRLGAPRDDSAEAGFARDMATHHAQAVDMSFVVRDKSSDRDLRTLASDIIVTQSTQRGMFMGWLQQWGLPQASARPRMAWMPGHAHMVPATDGAVVMHGMASDAELRSLRRREWRRRRNPISAVDDQASRRRHHHGPRRDGALGPSRTRADGEEHRRGSASGDRPDAGHAGGARRAAVGVDSRLSRLSTRSARACRSRGSKTQAAEIDQPISPMIAIRQE